MSAPATSTDELREEVERLRLLQSISLEFSASLDFDELLPTVFDRVLAALGAEGGSIWIADGDVLRCRIAVGGRRRAAGRRGDADRDRLRRRRGAAAADDHGDPGGRGPPIRARPRPATTLAQDVMATAMVAGGMTVGAIQVTNKVTGRRDLRRARPRAARRPRRHRRHRAPERAAPRRREARAGDLAVLLDISREITATLDLDRVLQSVVNLASRALPFDRAAVALYEKGHCDDPRGGRRGDGRPQGPPAPGPGRARRVGGRAGRAALPGRARRAGLGRRADVRHDLRPGPRDRRRGERALPAAQGRGGRARRPGVRVGHARTSPRRPSARWPRSSRTRPRWRSGTRSSTTRCRWWTRSAPWPPGARRCARFPGAGCRSTRRRRCSPSRRWC